MGLILFALGIISFLCALLGPVTQENLFIDGTYAFFFAAVLTFIFTGIKNAVQLFRKK